MWSRIISFACAGSFFVGCASTATSMGVDANLASTIASNHAAVILGSSNECVFSSRPGIEAGIIGAVLGAVLPALVDKGVSGLADYLSRRRDEKLAAYSASLSGRGASELYATNGRPDLACLIVYRGERGVAHKASGDWSVENLNRLGVSSPPEFFLETTLRYSLDGQAMRLVPVRLEYRSTAARKSSGTKDVLVSGFFEGVFAEGGEALENARFGAFQLYFPELSEGTIWSHEDMRGISTQWIPIPAPTMDEESEAAVSLVPLSAFVNVQETEDQGDLLLGVLGALSEAATEKKADISEVIAKALAARLGLEHEEDEESGEGDEGGE